MRLMTLQARNFRNFDRLELECGARFNILVGNNGQGKTNILESIYVLGQLRSFRGVGRAELTRWGAEVVSLHGTVEHPAHQREADARHVLEWTATHAQGPRP